MTQLKLTFHCTDWNITFYPIIFFLSYFLFNKSLPMIFKTRPMGVITRKKTIPKTTDETIAPKIIPKFLFEFIFTLFINFVINKSQLFL